jgi:hypothetical protein
MSNEGTRLAWRKYSEQGDVVCVEDIALQQSHPVGSRAIHIVFLTPVKDLEQQPAQTQEGDGGEGSTSLLMSIPTADRVGSPLTHSEQSNAVPQKSSLCVIYM